MISNELMVLVQLLAIPAAMAGPILSAALLRKAWFWIIGSDEPAL